jgi:hypothetical protein
MVHDSARTTKFLAAGPRIPYDRRPYADQVGLSEVIAIAPG